MTMFIENRDYGYIIAAFNSNQNNQGRVVSGLKNDLFFHSLFFPR